jgi:predicted TIM-barrel fold metal-dependent hydrolase
MSFNPAMFVIDCHSFWGKRVASDPRYTPDALRENLTRHSVAVTFAFSQRGLDYDSRTANREVLAVRQETPWVQPIAVLNPRDAPGFEAEFEFCRDAGIHAFRFFPGSQNWSVQSTLFRRQLKLISGSPSVLMFSSIDSYTGWEIPSQIAAVTADLGVPVIFVDTFYANMFEVLSTLREFPHTYIETNSLATTDALDTVVGEVGPARVLYGSSAPLRPMQKALNQILDARLPTADKAAILGGNAARLFHLDPTLWTGRPTLTNDQPARFDEPAIDVHSHLGYWQRPPYEDYTPDGMLRRMKQFNIRTGIVSAYESMRYDIAAGNRAIAAAIEGHPELKGCVELNPHQLELSCDEMDRYFAQPNFVGVEIELSHIPAPTAGPQVKKLIEAIARRGKPILFLPAGGGDALAERDLARAHPHLAFIHAHGFDPDWARIVADTPNIHVEFCLSRPSHHHLRECLDILGPERILFGTDQTLLSVASQVGLYLDADLSPRERRLILHDNACRLYHL